MQRYRAAEVAVNLYVQSENGERQDRMLDIQERRLVIEEAKLSKPGGPMFNQQNNFYLGKQQQEGEEVKEETPEEKAAALLARKKMQDMLLSSYLEPQKQQQQDEPATQENSSEITQELLPEDVLKSELNDLMDAGSNDDEE